MPDIELPTIDDLFAAQAGTQPVEDNPTPPEGAPPANPENPEDLVPGMKKEEVEEEETPTAETDDDPEDPEDSEESEESEEPSEPQPLIQELQQLLGYESETEYDDSPEGLVQFFRDSAEQHAEQQLDRIFQQYPLVQALLEYQLNGGDEEAFIQTFFGQSDYESLEIGEKDYALQERVFRDELKSRGYSEAEIEEEIEHAKSGDRLYKNSLRSLEILRKNQQQSQADLLKQQEEAAKAARRQQEELRQKIEDLIKTSTNLRGIPLPEKDKLAFSDYLLKQDSEGLTPYQRDLAKADLDIELATALLFFRGFDVSGIIQGRAKSQQAKSLRERLKSGKTPKSSGERPNQYVRPKNVDEIVSRIDYDAVLNS